jgi:hypothetical protein
MPETPRSSGTAAARDENRDGQLDKRDTTHRPSPSGARPLHARDNIDERSDTDRSGTPTDPGTTTENRGGATAVGRPTDAPTRGRDTTPEAPAGPRPRASVLATAGLVLGVIAAGFVLTGILAGYGIVLGALALLISIGGFMATKRRHVAGKSDAMFGLILGLAAIVVGILVLTGALSWLGTNTDAVGQLREWLDAQFVDRF